jgi:hypothetical protein
MSTIAVLVFALTFWVSRGIGQELPEPQQLQEALDDVGYVELLNAAQLTDGQLTALRDLQLRVQMEATVAPDLAPVLTKLLRAVLSGMSLREAQASLGEQQQVLQQAQQRWQQALTTCSGDLLKQLSAEQQDALVWFSSPAHALDGAVSAVAQTRGAPDAQWNQFKQQVGQALSQMISSASPGVGVTPAQIAQLLDAARAMDDATFEAHRPTLAREWLPSLMPNMSQRLQDPQFRQQQLAQVCQRLLAYPRGLSLVQARQESGPAQ